MSTEEYRPGTCNIGAAEQRIRRRRARIAFLIAAIWVGAILLGQVPKPLLVAVFIPVMLGVEWEIEGRTAFCVRLAARGRYTFGDRSGTVADAADRSTDISRAVRITGSAAAIAAAVTAVLYVLLSL